MGSLEKHLLPVRVRVEYNPNPDSGMLERVCYVECANGEILTGSIPFDWAQYIARELNKGRYLDIIRARRTDPIAILRLEGLPLQKTDAKIAILKDKIVELADNPAYIKSIQLAAAMGEDLFIERWAQLPISDPVTVTCEYYINGHATYSLPLCNAWVLDLLKELRIIKSAGHRGVKSMDGSRFIKATDRPHSIITIRRWAM